MDDLKLIKKYYGENMSHLCRKLFPTILNNEGKLFEIMSNHFAHTRCLYDDLVAHGLIGSFQNYIYGLIFEQKDLLHINKNPRELLDEAGYTLYECHTDWEMQRFRKYYHPDEVLCSFKEKRLNSCYVFFAVKKDVNKIKRSLIPRREDEYGTSVISIQFSRGDVNILSIKNRYNHTVKNADATFNNDLENIAIGLTNSFEKKYNLNIMSNKANFNIIEYNYILAEDGKYYHFNAEAHNIYYCDDNIIIDHGHIITKYQDKSKYLVFDYFILDLVNKKILLYEYSEIVNESFIETIGDIYKIEITKNMDKKTVMINDRIKLVIGKGNKLLSYENDTINHLPNNFLMYNYTVEELIIKNVLTIGDGCLWSNKNLYKLFAPNAQSIGNEFLMYNSNIQYLELNNLKEMHARSLWCNNTLKTFIAPKIEYIGPGVLQYNKSLNRLYVPNVKYFCDSFLKENKRRKLLLLLILIKKYLLNNEIRQKTLTKIKKTV